MAMNNFKIKDNGTVKKTIDLRDLVLDGLDQGEHTITIEGYLDDELITTSSKDITISASNLDPDYQAVIDYALSNSIPIPDSAQQQLDNDFIIALKSTGRWEKEDIFFKFTGTATSSFKLICWKRLIQATPYGSLTWEVEGVTGNGFNAYINPHFIPSVDGVNLTRDNGAIYAKMNYVEDSSTIVGIYQGSSDDRYMFWRPFISGGNGNFSYGANSSRPYSSTTGGLHAYGKTDTRIFAYSPTALPEDMFANTGELSDGEILILARNRTDNNEVDLYGISTIEYIGMGAEISTDYETLKTAIG